MDVSFVEFERLNWTSLYPAPVSRKLSLIIIKMPAVVDHMSTNILLGEAALQLSAFVLGDALDDEPSHFVAALAVDAALCCCGV